MVLALVHQEPPWRPLRLPSLPDAFPATIRVSPALVSTLLAVKLAQQEQIEMVYQDQQLVHAQPETTSSLSIRLNLALNVTLIARLAKAPQQLTV